MNNFRKEIIDELIPYFAQDNRYHLLLGDMGFGAADKITAEFPGRVTNFGVMEAGVTGIAAGMAMSSVIPIVYTIVNFLAFRALEQIRNDVVLQGLNVKFIGTGANDYFSELGDSHCCGDDDIRLMELIKVKVYDPYTCEIGFEELISRWITSPEPGYIRV